MVLSSSKTLEFQWRERERGGGMRRHQFRDRFCLSCQTISSTRFGPEIALLSLASIQVYTNSFLGVLWHYSNLGWVVDCCFFDKFGTMLLKWQIYPWSYLTRTLMLDYLVANAKIVRGEKKKVSSVKSYKSNQFGRFDLIF